MEVKGILEKIRHQDNQRKKYYFALEIGAGVVKSAVWAVVKEKIKVVSVGALQKWTGREELLVAVDNALTSAAESFVSEEEVDEPNKVIFGLPAHWVDQEKIFPEKLKILKNLSEKLELEPVGFVVIAEAINQYLKTTEGMPPTALLASLSKTSLFLTLLRLGKVSPTQIIKRSENLGDDVVEGLSRYEEKEAFPARILLYGRSREIEKDKQQLIDYPWQKEELRERGIVFLHLPKIEILADDFDIRAVALAGGREVARAAGMRVDFVEKKSAVKISGEKDEKKPLKTVDFGFIKEKDILQEGAKALSLPMSAEKTQEKIEEIEPKEDAIKMTVKKIETKNKASFKEISVEKKKWPFWLKKMAGLKKIFSLFRRVKPFSFFSSLVGISARFSWQKKTLIASGLVLTFLLVLIGTIVGFYWFIPKASVTLLVEPKILEEEFEVKFDPSLQKADKENFILPARKVETEMSGQKIKETTGTKLIGEKAKGEVTIFNGTDLEKTFKAGTIIISSNGAEFVLNNEVKIASQSGTAADPAPGKGVVAVTAVEIGSENNLVAQTEFSIDNYAKSDYVAKNESAFSGGTSRRVQIVSEEDQAELLKSLTEELESQSLEELKSMTKSKTNLIEGSAASLISQKVFDRKVGEEANQLGLNLKLKLTALAYEEEEIRHLAKEVMTKKIPDNYEFKEEESKIQFEPQGTSKEGKSIFKVRLFAKLIPEFDFQKIKRDLSGKYPVLGKSYLQNLPSVVGTEIKISPQLPDKILTFPRKMENIDLKIKIK